MAFLVRSFLRLLHRSGLFVVTAVWLSHAGCVRMSDRAVTTYFRNVPRKPSFHTLQTGDRTVHYAVMEVSTPGADAPGVDSLPVVVFVHGSPDGWHGYIQFFRDPTLYQQARLVALDRPGFGKSGWGRLERSLSKQAAAVAAVISAVSPSGRAVVVGYSYGGPVAARLAMDFPDRVRSLILVAPALDPDLETWRWIRPVLSAFPVRALLPTAFNVSNQEIGALRDELKQMLPRWSSVRVPVQVIQGERDKHVPPGNAAFARRVLVNAPVTIQMLPGENHFIPWRRPDTIHDAVLRAIIDPR